MNIKVGDIELTPWKFYNYSSNHCWIREDFYTYERTAAAGIYSKNDPNIWELICWYDLEFINGIYGNRIILGTEDEVKEIVDNFLLRINKMIAFI